LVPDANNDSGGDAEEGFYPYSSDSFTNIDSSPVSLVF
jgi:hypothetical protein